MICATTDRGRHLDVVVRLRSLGLGKYEAAFRENEIDETVLPSLTEEHLKQLGVTALGRRLKLLDAIAALRNDASVKTPSRDIGRDHLARALGGRLTPPLSVSLAAETGNRAPPCHRSAAHHRLPL
jgi:SAM domain (Sterile alpha motif)